MIRFTNNQPRKANTMDYLHPVMQEALRGFAPPPQEDLENDQDRFEYEVQSQQETQQ